MDVVNGSSCGLVDKLVNVLTNITESHFKIADDSYLEKLQSNIRGELDKNGCKHLQSHLFAKWFENTIQRWNETPPDASVAGFVIRFIGAFARNEREFNLVQRSNTIDGLLHCLDMEVYGSSPLKVAYICLLSDVINHNSGFLWVKEKKAWKNVIRLCISNSSIYVEREASKFLRKFLDPVKTNDCVLEEILREVLVPLVTCGDFASNKNSDFDGKIHNEEKLQKKISPSLKLLAVVLEVCISMSDTCSNSVPSLLMTTFEIEPILKRLLETCEGEQLLELTASSYAMLVLLNVSHDPNNPEESVIKHIPDGITDILKIFIKRHKINNVIKVSKLCQCLWGKMASRDCTIQFDPELEVHFLVIQLLPVLMFIKKKSRMNSFLDSYVQKLFDITTEQTQRMAYLMRDVIQDSDDISPMDCAVKGVLSLTKNIESVSLDQAVIILQALAYTFKEFVPRACDEDEPVSDEEYEAARLLSVSGGMLLSAILNAICTIIEKFKIDWTRSLETLCLLRFTSILLDNPHLSPLLAVQTLLLIKLCILNFLSPNLALLMSPLEGSSFECLMPLLYKRLHDPNWEIRDSCVEVVTVIAELADTKYPAYQDMLLETNLPSLIVAIAEGDSESYVRASAIRALSAMIKIKKLWDQNLNSHDIPSKVVDILMNESEGIVRREAALLAREIYEHRNCRPEVEQTFYQIIGRSATYDLHWEVKVNALCFWEKVIQRFLANQGMIDGFFPSVTFSKENKKIVTLTNEEIRLRLNKVLIELSNIGCLYVLLTTLHDDCDFQVVQKSAEILRDFLSMLKRYNMLRSSTNNSGKSDKNPAKRKTSDEGCCEKRRPTCKEEIMADDEIGAKSDKIIEDIVNEMDINLLVSVVNPGKRDVKSNCEILIKTIKPEIFLNEMEMFDLNNFLNEKRRWLADSGDDLNTLLTDILNIHSGCETNILDCY